MAKPKRARLLKADPAPHSYEELRLLYEGTYHLWLDAGGFLAADRPAPLARSMLLMTDICPSDPGARRLKAMWAVEMLTTKRLQRGTVCDAEAVAVSALLDFIGRQ